MNSAAWIKKRLPYLLLALLSAMAVLSLPVSVLRDCRAAERRTALLEEAEDLMQRRIYLEAADRIGEAMRIGGESPALLTKLADCCAALGEREKVLKICRQIMTDYPGCPEAYVLSCREYRQAGNYAAVYALAERARACGAESPELSGLLGELDSVLTERYLPASSVGPWHPTAEGDLAVAVRDGLCWLMRPDGKFLTETGADEIGMYDVKTGTYPCLAEEDWFCADTAGNRRLAPRTPADWIGTFADGIAPVRLGDEYAYADTSFRLLFRGLEYAGAFREGTAAVRKDGKWALWGASLCSLSAFVYDEIAVDDCGFCVRFGRCAVKKDGLWYLSDSSGRLLSEGHEGLAFAASADGSIAFCDGGRWGFMDRSGRVVTEPVYDGAGSFSCGLAPVKTDGVWHYIDEKGRAVGSGVYETAGTFSRSGTAAAGRNGCLYLVTVSRCVGSGIPDFP